MTIKVSDLSSLAVGQETFYHKDFQRSRQDLLKNLQRRSSCDTKNGKKRKKAKISTDDVFLISRLDALQQELNYLREENVSATAAIRNLLTENAAKDNKLDALEMRLERLERKSPSNRNSRPIQQQDLLPQDQRLQGKSSFVENLDLFCFFNITFSLDFLFPLRSISW